MTGARTTTLAQLRSHIARLEKPDGHPGDCIPLGHAAADEALQGGLRPGVLHEVFAEAGRQAAPATGFLTGLAGRLAARRPLVWIRQDFSDRETGALSLAGLAEFGLDPRALVTVRAPDTEASLRIAADALACDALGAVVVEIWGETRRLDLVASRKLTLAAQSSGVTALMLRIGAEPHPSTAETRWIVRAAHSPPAAPWSAWGTPVFDVQLVRNRHGLHGRWIMEWTCDECLFAEPSSHPQSVSAAPAHRPHPAAARAQQRRIA